MSKSQQRVDFDEYADEYEGLLQEQLAFFSSDRGYFSEYKAALTARLIQTPPKKILDFGCGIGLTLPYLTSYFPAAEISATDLSNKSLDHVARAYPQVQVLRDDVLNEKRFDLIFVAGVFHHIPPGERPAVVKRLSNLLEPGGTVCVFDHNPYNPVTQRMVSTCPFDTDAVLLTRREMSALLSQAKDIAVQEQHYCLFFPEALRGLQSVERWLGWLPLGGQYVVVARKR